MRPLNAELALGRLLAVCAGFALALSAVQAQDLDTTAVSDTFDSGTRGNTFGTGPTFCNSLLDGTEFQTLTDTDGVTGTIVYINTWAGCTTSPQEDETPVVDFTVGHANQDRPGNTIAAIAANPNDSVSPNNGIIVGDDGGFNTLFFGETDDTDYVAQVDVYCYDRTSPGTGYEVYGLAVRGGRNDEPADVETGGISYDRQGSYSLEWDAQLGIASARRWEANWSGGTGSGSGDIANRDPATFTEFAQQALTGDQWHTFSIECVGSQIKFFVNGSLLTSETDTTYANGRAGLTYRESGIGEPDETQGHFDNLVAGPPPPPPPITAVGEFSLYR